MSADGMANCPRGDLAESAGPESMVKLWMVYTQLNQMWIPQSREPPEALSGSRFLAELGKETANMYIDSP